MDSELLVIRNLVVAVDGRRLLELPTLRVRRGERLSVVGPNGAGKTTFLKAIAGLSRAYMGSILLEGDEVRGMAPDRVAAAVAFVPQRMQHLPPFTVAEFLELSGSSRRSLIARLVDHLRTRTLPELSAGELQRVLLAGALAQGATLLLLDEPTSNLDPAGRAQVEVLLGELALEEVALILVTHDVSLAVRVCSRLVIVSGGRIAWEGGVNDDALVSQLEGAYGSRFLRIDNSELSSALIVAHSPLSIVMCKSPCQ